MPWVRRCVSFAAFEDLGDSQSIVGRPTFEIFGACDGEQHGKDRLTHEDRLQLLRQLLLLPEDRKEVTARDQPRQIFFVLHAAMSAGTSVKLYGRKKEAAAAALSEEARLEALAGEDESYDEYVPLRERRRREAERRAGKLGKNRRERERELLEQER